MACPSCFLQICDLTNRVMTSFAQFIAVCSSAKPCAIGENLLSVSDPISRPEERLSHVGARIRPPTLQRRPVSRLHAYITMDAQFIAVCRRSKLGGIEARSHR